MEESVVKLEPSKQSSTSESDYFDGEDENVQTKERGEQQDSEDTSFGTKAIDSPMTFNKQRPKRLMEQPERYGFANIPATYEKMH